MRLKRKTESRVEGMKKRKKGIVLMMILLFFLSIRMYFSFEKGLYLGII